MATPICHRTIGPNALIQTGWEDPTPRPCIGSACAMWRVRAHDKSTGWCGDNTEVEGMSRDDPAAEKP